MTHIQARTYTWTPLTAIDDAYIYSLVKSISSNSRRSVEFG